MKKIYEMINLGVSISIHSVACTDFQSNVTGLSDEDKLNVYKKNSKILKKEGVNKDVISGYLADNGMETFVIKKIKVFSFNDSEFDD